ncbi:MAG: methylated-DNA--[protein]-cysteine S-methyltransferase [Deltaproteobacteria bacterium]|jgi:methylated-DNA-[protein]-cysteine S-methyltransferase|nr:methylated-DNA--[protein]-cysteine S-methyltransferase [Deltaproteobacteria bacterium]
MTRLLAAYESPLGTLTLASDGRGLTGLWIAGQKHHGAEGTPPPGAGGGDGILEAARDWLDRYFAGERPDAAGVPLNPAGTLFRLAVWEFLKGIPYGRTVTYAGIAHAIDWPGGRAGRAPRAVGGAVGHNPVSIIIPCHRVVGANGDLTGYAGGIGRKAWLLEHEGADTSRLRMPGEGTAH